jgi:hypothetical protein
MEDIYSKIKMAEEYLSDLRKKLEADEKDYQNGVKTAANLPYTLAARISPFVNATWASAKAAAITSGAASSSPTPASGSTLPSATGALGGGSASAAPQTGSASCDVWWS